MGGSQSQSEIVNEMNDMTATVIVNIALFCNATSIGDQTISINCTPDVPSGKAYEANNACTACFDNLLAAQLNYYAAQQNAWATQPASVKLPIDTDFQEVIAAFVACSSTACKACPVQNVSQVNVIQSTLNCSAFNNVTNTISQNLITAIDQKLTNNQDMLSPLATMLGASSYSSVVTNIANRMTALITDNVISAVQQNIDAQQKLVFTGSSTTSSGITQQSVYTATTNFLQNTNLMNNVFTDAQWTTLQDLINQQNTIDTLGNTVTKTVEYLSKALTNIVGKVVIFVVALVIVVFIAVVLYVGTQLIKKGLRKQHDKDIALKTQAETVPAFETF